MFKQYTLSKREGFLFILLTRVGLFFALCSCGTVSKLFEFKDPYAQALKNHQEVAKQDFVEHLLYLSKEYLRNPNVSFFDLSKTNTDYLKSIYNRIVHNNEILLDSKIKPEFHIVESRMPFYFSLPGGKFYLSTSLMKNYLKSEDWLVALITVETIRSHRLLYEKKIVVPLGFITTEKMLGIVQVPLEVSKDINKWAFYSLIRSGYDGSALLNWIQIQNKNSYDFILQFGNTSRISLEEQYVRNLIADESHDITLPEIESENSSKDFYVLIKEINRAHL